MPLQAYFRINAENMGQFERTLIIADEGSKVHYIEGCSAPVYTSDSLHSAVVEDRGEAERPRHLHDDPELVVQRVQPGDQAGLRVEAEGHMEWIDGNIGSRLTMKYPAVWLAGPKATGEVLSVAYAGPGQHQDTGAKMVHAAPETSIQDRLQVDLQGRWTLGPATGAWSGSRTTPTAARATSSATP